MASLPLRSSHDVAALDGHDADGGGYDTPGQECWQGGPYVHLVGDSGNDAAEGRRHPGGGVIEQLHEGCAVRFMASAGGSELFYADRFGVGTAVEQEGYGVLGEAW